MRDHYGAADGRSCQLRFHTQTAGVSLTAQQPEVNLVRVAIEALAGVLGGTQSLHTDSFDEALALPTEHAARLALRTQQVIAEETGVVHVADPLGGSWFVEELTDELERQAERCSPPPRPARDRCSRGLRLHRRRLVRGEIADAAYAFQSKIAKDEWIMVGVNGYVEEDGVAPSTLSIGAHVETEQLERLAAVKQARDDDAVRACTRGAGQGPRRPDQWIVPLISSTLTGVLVAVANGVSVGDGRLFVGVNAGVMVTLGAGVAVEGKTPPHTARENAVIMNKIIADRIKRG